MLRFQPTCENRYSTFQVLRLLSDIHTKSPVNVLLICEQPSDHVDLRNVSSASSHTSTVVDGSNQPVSTLDGSGKHTLKHTEKTLWTSNPTGKGGLQSAAVSFALHLLQ